MCKAILYAANTQLQTVAEGGIVNFGTVIRQMGGSIELSGGNVNISGVGYYNADASFSFVAEATGVYTIQLYKDGTPIVGARASATVVADATVNMAIPFVVRNTCCCDSTITAVISGGDATVSVASITIEKK